MFSPAVGVCRFALAQARFLALPIRQPNGQECRHVSSHTYRVGVVLSKISIIKLKKGILIFNHDDEGLRPAQLTKLKGLPRRGALKGIKASKRQSQIPPATILCVVATLINPIKERFLEKTTFPCYCPVYSPWFIAC